MPLLSTIIADPERYQLRDSAYSADTVNGIVTEGLHPAKYDPIPVMVLPDGRYCVAGDGHSRFEAIKRLAAQNRLPDDWRAGDDWDIPCRTVTEAQASDLKLANFNRDNFTPAEAARIFAAMQADGLDVDEIAKRTHKSATTVRRMLLVNQLPHCIRERIGKAPNAGGLSIDVAVEMAELFQRYAFPIEVQQELWTQVFALADMTPSMVRGIIHKFAKKLGSAERGEDMLFAVPPRVRQAIDEMAKRAKSLRRVERALSALVAEVDMLDALPLLKAIIQRDGESMLAQIKYEADADGALIGSMVLAA